MGRSPLNKKIEGDYASLLQNPKTLLAPRWPSQQDYPVPNLRNLRGSSSFSNKKFDYSDLSHTDHFRDLLVDSRKKTAED